MRQLSVVSLTVLALFAGGWDRSAVAVDPIRDSVVKIHTVQRLPNFVSPWTKGNTRPISGSGAIIAGNRILTNAHVVMYASQIRVQANGSTERVPATVEAVAPGIDLAVLKLADESVFQERPPLQLGEAIPKIKDTVNAYGYPMGGEQQSVTEGIVSRIEYTGFAYGDLGLRIQVDTPLNSGNSGGPAIADGKIVGLVMARIPGADNIGYLIAADEIRMFLADIEDGHYDGKPQLNDFMQTVENPALRARLELPAKVGGLMVSKSAASDAPDDSPLRQWDVVTHIGDVPLDNQGNIRVAEELTLSFRYLVPKQAHDNQIQLTVFRDGQSVQVQVPVHRRENELIGFLKGDYPQYFICGPMIFSAASQELLAGLGDQGQAMLAARKSPLISRRFEQRKKPTDELVVLGHRMFTHPMTEGYDAQIFAVVTRVNDVEIQNLPHLVQTIRQATGKFITFYLGGMYETVVFDRQEMLDATEQILEDEGIRNQMSDELAQIWAGDAPAP